MRYEDVIDERWRELFVLILWFDCFFYLVLNIEKLFIRGCSYFF